MPASAENKSNDAKRLNQMDRLSDMGRFPVSVLCGAVLNILVTIGVVWHFEPRTEDYAFALPLWVFGVLALNLLPVLLLRLFTLGPSTKYPVIEQMDFFRDQHKFSDWVYLAASANMAFWICTVWLASYTWHKHSVIIGVMAAAVVGSLSPAWLRRLRRAS